MYKLLIGLLLTSNAMATSYRCDGKLLYTGIHFDEARVANIIFSEESQKVSVAEVKFNYTSSAMRRHTRMQGEVYPCREDKLGCYGLYLPTAYNDPIYIEVHPEDERQDILIHDTGRGERVYVGKFNCRQLSPSF